MTPEPDDAIGVVPSDDCRSRVEYVVPPDGCFHTIEYASAQGGVVSLDDSDNPAVYLEISSRQGTMRSMRVAGFVLSVEQAADLVVELSQAARVALHLNGGTPA